MSSDVHAFINSLPNKSNYVIDIGASTGAGTAYPVLCDETYSGIAIECAEANCEKLKQSVRNPKIHIHCGYATPDSICGILQKYNAPHSPDLIKVDIDGYDLQVIRSILTSYRPKVIYAEINEKIPPPIHFEILYNPDYFWDSSHCFGFSIAAGNSVMQENGYAILQIHGGNNILCIDKQLLMPDSRVRDVKTIYDQDYKLNPVSRSFFPWNEDVNYWLDITDPHVLVDMINEYFTKFNPRGKPIIPSTFDLHIAS
jgi:hypothetical protein